jgi:proteasome lid subunit RPN8/RPN11
MSKAPKVKIKLQPVVVMEAEVARQIRQHCRTSMKAEVCGVLIGEATEDRTVVEACIAGENAAQGGAHVTFTQDTWEHIYKIKDKEHPDAKIVGWYHSHPGFGVFLSEHDLFIHENFFSSPNQVAWVFDPHTDEEGCFGWVSGKIEKLTGVRFGYSQSVDLNGSEAGNANFDHADDDGEHSRGAEDLLGKRFPASRAEEPAWVKWVSWSLGYLAAVVLGAAVGFLFGERNVAKKVEQELGPTLGACQQILEHPVQACQEMLQHYGPAPSGATTLPAETQPKAAPQNSSPAGKGKNGKR